MRKWLPADLASLFRALRFTNAIVEIKAVPVFIAQLCRQRRCEIDPLRERVPMDVPDQLSP